MKDKEKDITKYRYVKVPFRLIPLAYKVGGLKKLVLYSIYSEALELPFEVENVSKRILILFLRGDKNKWHVDFPQSIYKLLYDMEEETPFIACNEDDFKGYDPLTQQFDPWDENEESVIKRLNQKFTENPSLWEQATLWYRIYSFLHLCGISVNFPFEKFQIAFNKLCVTEYGYRTTDWNRGHAGFNINLAVNILQDEIRWQVENPPKKHASKEYIDLYKQIMERKVMLAADMAMKSIKGRKAIGNATKAEILARMVGNRSISEKVDVNDQELDPECRDMVKRFGRNEYFYILMAKMRGNYFRCIDTIKGSEASGWFFTNSRDMSKEQLEQGIYEIITANKKENARHRSQRFRHKLKKNTFKSIGLTPKKPEPIAPNTGVVHQQPFPPMQPQQQAPMTQQFPPTQGGYQQSVPVGYPQQPMQQMQGYQQPVQQSQGYLPFPPPIDQQQQIQNRHPFLK